MPDRPREHADSLLVFSGKDDKRLKPGADFRGKRCRGSIREAHLEGADFSGAIFEDLDARGAHLSGATMWNLTIAKADFRRANLTEVREFHTVRRLQMARFGDNTIVDGLDLDQISRYYPLVARSLKQIRYVGRLKRESPHLYWPWQTVCACGRSWVRLLAFGAVLVLGFSLLYFAGAAQPDSKWLPHILLDGHPDGSGLSYYHCLEFSAMTLVGFNMARIEWSDMHTGIWVAAEAWFGLAFIGIFITVVAVKMATNQ